MLGLSCPKVSFLNGNSFEFLLHSTTEFPKVCQRTLRFCLKSEFILFTIQDILSRSVEMFQKVLWTFVTLYAVSFAALISPEDTENFEKFYDELSEIEPYLFESKILEAINKLKDFMKNGNPSNGVSPLDPFFLSYKDFDFVIDDTVLEGFFKNVTFARFSDFEPTNIAFKLFPLHFKIDVFLKELLVDGRYKMVGNIFNEIPVNGTGKFISNIQNISMSLYVKPTRVNSSLQIQDLLFDFNTRHVNINYTNELESNELQVLEENLALYILDQIRAKYIPSLLTTGKLVLNHFLLGYSFMDVLKFILGLINNSK